jgi:hypothetical protein
MRRTLKFGRGSYFAKKLDKVGQVIAEELGFEDEVFAGVVGADFGSKELRFANNSQRRPSLGVLEAN